MGILNGSFFRVRKPRGFQYQPRFYDERKERLERLRSGQLDAENERRARMREAWKSNQTAQPLSGRTLYRLVLGGLLVWGFIQYVSGQ
jgi:hypothetical protein